MKILKTVTVEHLSTQVEKCFCNKCGDDTIVNRDGCGEVIEFENTFGYFSNKFGDMTRVRFDICEACLKEFVESFKIPAEITSLL